MKTSESLLVGVFLSAILGSGLGTARANDLSLKTAPVEPYYCRESPTIDQNTESWIPAAPSANDSFIDVDEGCTNDPPGLEPTQRAEAMTLGGHF